MDVSSKQSLVEKYIELNQLKIDPAEKDEEERLASAMRTYQVTESSVPTDDPMEMLIFGIPAPIMAGLALMAVPATPVKTSRSTIGRCSSSSKKKSQRKRKWQIGSDDSDCDPHFNAFYCACHEVYFSKLLNVECKVYPGVCAVRAFMWVCTVTYFLLYHNYGCTSLLYLKYKSTCTKDHSSKHILNVLVDRVLNLLLRHGIKIRPLPLL